MSVEGGLRTKPISTFLSSSTWNEKRGILDLQLEQMGYIRQIAIKTPSILSSPFIVEESDLLMTIPRLAAEKLLTAINIKIFALPFKIPSFEVKICSYIRSDKRLTG
ncbi:hypothetical protein DH21_22415 [Serratia marcescens]|nr:hypothetical protein DH21_22415 [Serratia marcescens]